MPFNFPPCVIITNRCQTLFILLNSCSWVLFFRILSPPSHLDRHQKCEAISLVHLLQLSLFRQGMGCFSHHYRTLHSDKGQKSTTFECSWRAVVNISQLFNLESAIRKKWRVTRNFIQSSASGWLICTPLSWRMKTYRSQEHNYEIIFFIANFSVCVKPKDKSFTA